MSVIVAVLWDLLEMMPEALAKIHTGHLGTCEVQLMPHYQSLSR